MKKTSIHPADAADDMERSYDREVRRHRRQRRRTLNMAVSWGVVFLLVAAGGFALLKRNDAAKLPEAGFEVAAERKAADAKVASAKPKTTAPATRHAPTASSSSGTRVASARTSTAKKSTAKKTVSTATAAARTSMSSPITAASIGAPHAVRLGVTNAGYQPSQLTVPSGVPVEITVDGITGGDYVGFQIASLHISANNDGQAATVLLPPLRPGTYSFSSFVGTIKGTLVVK